MSQSKPIRVRLARVGNSVALRIPRRILEQLGLPTRLPQAGEQGPEVEMQVDGELLLVRPIREQLSLFEERIVPLLDDVSGAAPEVQQLVLQILASTVDWVSKANAVSVQLVSVLRDLHSYYRDELEQTKQRSQRLWERQDLLWFLIISRVVTAQRAEAVSGRLSYARVAGIVATAKRDPVEDIEAVLHDLNKFPGSHKRAEAILNAYVQIDQAGGLDAQEAAFRAQAREDRRELSRFLRRFESGPNGQYEGVYGMPDYLKEVYDPSFSQHVIIQNEMRALLRRLDLAGIGSPPQELRDAAGRTAYERFYEHVAEAARLEAWELEHLIEGYPEELSQRLRDRSKLEVD